MDNLTEKVAQAIAQEVGTDCGNCQIEIPGVDGAAQGAIAIVLEAAGNAAFAWWDGEPEDAYDLRNFIRNFGKEGPTI